MAALSFNGIEFPCFIITVKCNQDGHECVSVVYVQLLSVSLISVCKYNQIMIFFSGKHNVWYKVFDCTSSQKWIGCCLILVASVTQSEKIHPSLLCDYKEEGWALGISYIQVKIICSFFFLLLLFISFNLIQLILKSWYLIFINTVNS